MPFLIKPLANYTFINNLFFIVFIVTFTNFSNQTGKESQDSFNKLTRQSLDHWYMSIRKPGQL
jgi:hypothetical protein